MSGASATPNRQGADRGAGSPQHAGPPPEAAPPELGVKTPAFFIAFDALQIDGIELLALPYAQRRRRL